MKKKILYTALFALLLASCSEQEFIEQPSTPAGGTEVQFPTDVTSGELLIKFDPAMTEILDQALKVATRSGGAMTRSGIPSTDEVSPTPNVFVAPFNVTVTSAVSLVIFVLFDIICAIVDKSTHEYVIELAVCVVDPGTALLAVFTAIGPFIVSFKFPALSADSTCK